MAFSEREKKLAQSTVDFAAVGRVSKYIELNDIRLTEVSAKFDPVANIGPLASEFAHECTVAGHGKDFLDVACGYHFAGRTGQTQAIEILIKYLLSYTVNASEPLAEEDISQFAISNGTLHSWPFVREFLHELTSRMGVPPFKLGVMHFVPQKPVEKAPKEEISAAEQNVPQG
jgi:hypothetical protein